APSAPVVPPPAADAVEAPGEARTPAVEPETAVLVVHRRMQRWRAFAIVMTLVVAAVAALLAAWRFLPDRVPPMLQPVDLMRQRGVARPAAPAARRRAPPGSQFDEGPARRAAARCRKFLPGVSRLPHHGARRPALARPQKKARPRARKVRGLRTRKLSADRARLAGRGGHRLARPDHGGFPPARGRARRRCAGGHTQ